MVYILYLSTNFALFLPQYGLFWFICPFPIINYIHASNGGKPLIWLIIFPARDLHKGQLGLIPSHLMMQPKQNVWRHGSSTEASTLMSRQMEQASPMVSSLHRVLHR